MRARGPAATIALGIAAAIALVFAGACSWALEGYSGGPDDSAAPDVATPSSEGGATDAGADADGARADADSGQGFCVRANAKPTDFFLCDDFDDINAKLPLSDMHSTISLTAADYVSPPNALHLDVGSLSTPSSARLAKNFGMAPRRIRVSADLKVTKCDSQVNVLTFFFQAKSPDRTGALAFQFHSAGYHLIDQVDLAAGGEDFKAYPVAPQTWPAAAFSHIEMTWHDDLTADLVIDKVPIFTALQLFASGGKGTVSLEYGVSYSNGIGNCAATLDNVLVDGDL